MWPLWLLDMFSPTDGPYSWWKSGKQVSKRNGSPRTHTSVGVVKVPACAICNGFLHRRFEWPAKPLIRSLLAEDGNVVFRGTDAIVVAQWFMKTWLLLLTPQPVNRTPVSPPLAGRLYRKRGMDGWSPTSLPPPGSPSGSPGEQRGYRDLL